MVVPPRGSDRDPSYSTRTSDQPWNRLPGSPLLLLIGLCAFVLGVVTRGFWAGVIAFLCVAVVTGTVRGAVRGVKRGWRETRDIREERRRRS